MTNLKWRLGKLPTVEELLSLINNKLITQEEAKTMLFSSEEEDRDKESLQEEIKFLRKLVEKLSENKTTRIIETIKEVERPWSRWEWYRPYQVWCTSDSATSHIVTSGTSYVDATSSISVTNTSASAKPFSDIKTF